MGVFPCFQFEAHGARLHNGLLKINHVQVTPASMKTKRISINTDKPQPEKDEVSPRLELTIESAMLSRIKLKQLYIVVNFAYLVHDTDVDLLSLNSANGYLFSVLKECMLCRSLIYPRSVLV